MALDLRISFQGEPSRNDPGSENHEFNPRQVPAVQDGERISKFPSTQHSLFQNGKNSCARQELQRLYKLFHSWLQPEKHSKDEMISRLVLEQFMINGYCSDRSMLKEKWESSGRNLEKFMEDLTDDGMKPPGLVHVCMQGQEALFSENMPLREVIVHLRKQFSTGTQTGENMGTPFQTPKDHSLETEQGDEDKENGGNISLKTCQVNDSMTSQGNQTPSLLIIQGENRPGPGEGGVPLENPLSSRRADLGSCRSQEESLKGPPYQDVLIEVRPGFLSRPNQVTPERVPTHQSIEGNSACGGHQERSQGAPKSYKCEKCPRIFRYLSRLKAHQRRHNNERTFICGQCDKGFFQASDLRMHQKIHTGEKPFKCSTCEMSFSHKTNLRAHERIHTGEKPYVCSLCQRSYRQSSTYHRHLRTHQKIAFKSVPSRGLWQHTSSWIPTQQIPTTVRGGEDSMTGKHFWALAHGRAQHAIVALPVEMLYTEWRWLPSTLAQCRQEGALPAQKVPLSAEHSSQKDPQSGGSAPAWVPYTLSVAQARRHPAHSEGTPTHRAWQPTGTIKWRLSLYIACSS
nr:PREDICTED: zinc finger and SCAN domain-containing protein 4-like [Equus przewalskii]